MTTPQLKQITFVTSLMHKDNEDKGQLLFNMRLNESVLSEAISFDYEIHSQKAESYFLTIFQVIKGSNENRSIVALFSNAILLKSGVKDFEIGSELSIPFIGLDSLTTRLIKTVEGTTSFELIKNQEMVVRVYYSMPSVTS